MNWHPSQDFRLDLGYVNHDDFQGNPLTLPHADLTHLGLWSRGILTEQGIVAKEAEAKGKTFDKALAGAAFFLWLLGPAFNAISQRFKSGLTQPVQTAVDRLHHATELYKAQHGGDVHKILADEQKRRWETGTILQGDLDKDILAATRLIHPAVNYKNRVRWILINLEPVKTGFPEDYAYWKGIAQLLEETS